MSGIIVGTNLICMDEPCYNLSEVNLQAPDSRGFRRYQVITVIRDDQKVQMMRNLGPANAFDAAQFRIPGGVTDEATGHVDILHTVGELNDIAEHLRHREEEPVEPSDLIGGYHDHMEQKKNAARGRIVIAKGDS